MGNSEVFLNVGDNNVSLVQPCQRRNRGRVGDSHDRSDSGKSSSITDYPIRQSGQPIGHSLAAVILPTRWRRLKVFGFPTTRKNGWMTGRSIFLKMVFND